MVKTPDITDVMCQPGGRCRRTHATEPPEIKTYRLQSGRRFRQRLKCDRLVWRKKKEEATNSYAVDAYPKKKRKT